MLAVAVVIGLAVQPFREGGWTDPVGTVAYAGAAVGLMGVLLPRGGALLPGLIGTGLACGVELAQLTGIPARLAGQLPAVALLLGGRFDAADLVWLLVGGAARTFALTLRPSTGGRAAVGVAGASVAE